MQTPFLETAPEQCSQIIHRNYGYLIQSSALAVPRMRASGGGGSIVNITTIEAHRAAPGFAVYAGAKAATTKNSTDRLRSSWLPERIRVNTVAPEAIGWEKTSMPAANWREPEPQEEFVTAGFKMYVPLGECRGGQT